MEQNSSSSVSDSVLRITGAWTKAGVASCVHLEGPHFKLLFDCGVNDSAITSADHVFISHGHLDHAGACVLHARSRALTHAPATYYIPAVIAEPMAQVKKAFEQMDDREIPMNIKIVKPSDIISIGSQYLVKVFETIHRVPSQGYAIYRLSKGKLLPAYSDLTQNELKALRSQGVNIISSPIETLDTVYTGDTTFQGVLNNPFILQAPVLIMECTYLDGAREKANTWSHVHIEDIVEFASMFQNRQLVLVHLSQKYSCSRALELLRLQLPDDLVERVVVNLRSFGSSEMLTKINDHRWSKARNHVAGWGWTNSQHANRGQDKYHESGYRQNHRGGGSSSREGSMRRGSSSTYGNEAPRSAWTEQESTTYVEQSNEGRGGGRAVFRESRTYRVQNSGPYQKQTRGENVKRY
jgi:ribonuclease Z